ncbi:hypothetical protein AB0M13_09760 [Nocardia fluminea]
MTVDVVDELFEFIGKLDRQIADQVRADGLDPKPDPTFHYNR